MEEIDVSSPDFVRLASYLAAAGRTWFDRDKGGLITMIRPRFRYVVYPLFTRFYPKAKRSIIATNQLRKDKMGVERVQSTISFRIEDSEVLESIEELGFSLGSKHRRPPAYVINNPELFKVYLRVVWEVHGTADESGISLVQKFPQELEQLSIWLNFAGIVCSLSDNGKEFYLRFEGRDATKKFFDLIDWQADGSFGKEKIDKVKKFLG